MSSAIYETEKFSYAIRAYHVWQPKENKTLQCDHESDYDCHLFSIKTRVPPTDSGSSNARNFSVYKIFPRSWNHNNCYSK